MLGALHPVFPEAGAQKARQEEHRPSQEVPQHHGRKASPAREPHLDFRQGNRRAKPNQTEFAPFLGADKHTFFHVSFLRRHYPDQVLGFHLSQSRHSPGSTPYMPVM